LAVALYGTIILLYGISLLWLIHIVNVIINEKRQPHLL
jgi:hypothetical protein